MNSEKARLKKSPSLLSSAFAPSSEEADIVGRTSPDAVLYPRLSVLSAIITA